MLESTLIEPGEQGRALWVSTIAFAVCFAVWTIFSIIGVRIAKELGLNDTQFGLLIGTPILSGAISRVALGIWTDQFGGRLVYTLVMLLAAVATFLLASATTYISMLAAALGMGLVSYHLIQFSREAFRGDQNASFYSARSRALAAPTEPETKAA